MKDDKLVTVKWVKVYTQKLSFAYNIGEVVEVPLSEKYIYAIAKGMAETSDQEIASYCKKVFNEHRSIVRTKLIELIKAKKPVDIYSAADLYEFNQDDILSIELHGRGKFKYLLQNNSK